MWKNLGVKLLLMRNEEATRCSNHSGWSSGRCLKRRACSEVLPVQGGVLFSPAKQIGRAHLFASLPKWKRCQGCDKNLFFFPSPPSLHWSAKSRCLSCFRDSFKMRHQRRCVRSICKNTSGVGYRNKWDMAPSLGSFEMQAVWVNLLWNASLRCV